MKRKNNKLFLIVCLVCLLGIGFALISTELKINGSVMQAKVTMDINPVFVAKLATSDGATAAAVSNNSLNFDLSLREPGDYVSYIVEMSNTGTLDAMYSGVDITGFDERYVEVTVTHDDEEELMEYDSFASGTNTAYLVTVSYKDIEKENLPEEGIASNVELEFNYSIATDEVLYTGHDYKYFDYTGGQQTFKASKAGVYKLEVWGQQGQGNGSINPKAIGGYGGYTVGKVDLTENKTIYVNVGGGDYSVQTYNGGGYFIKPSNYSAGIKHLFHYGGGATHIGSASGQLKSLSNRDTVYLIAGGGGGNKSLPDIIPAGGGWDATAFVFDTYRATGGTHLGGGIASTDLSCTGKYGLGGDTVVVTMSDQYNGGASGGGGYFGGAGTPINSGAATGGSSYIGGVKTGTGVMYCYNCEEHLDEVEGYTIVNAKAATHAIPKYSKKGNGYARISYLEQ